MQMLREKNRMKTQVIRQAVTRDCLFRVLTDWCRDGAGATDQSIRIMSAFASGAGVAALAPFLDVFLARGNRVEIICGIDRNGTDAQAIRELYALQSSHGSTVSVRIFNAPSKGAIFQPKLYLRQKRRHVDFVIGSANMTSGGMGSNFESLLLYQDCPRRSSEASHALTLWDIFADPQPPMKTTFLRVLTRKERDRLCRKLPKKSQWEKRSARKEVSELWRPLSKVRLPHSGRVQHRRPPTSRTVQGNYLLMDVLRETRKTQMQIPLKVVTGFFGLGRRQRANLIVSEWDAEGIRQPIVRPIVISEGPNRNRLMRRIEVPPIKDLKRNLAIFFIKLRGERRFAYAIIQRGTTEYDQASRLLSKEGQQGKGKRRYIIGTKGDSLWTKANKMLPR